MARALPCGHTMCHGCVSSLLRDGSYRLGGAACPMCRAPLPAVSASSLLRIYALEGAASESSRAVSSSSASGTYPLAANAYVPTSSAGASSRKRAWDEVVAAQVAAGCPQFMQKWSAQDDATLLARAAAGVPVAAIAAELGRGIGGVTSRLKAHSEGTATHEGRQEKRRRENPNYGAPWTQGADARLAQLFSSGVSKAAIGREMGRNSGAIHSRLKHLGLLG